MRVSAYVRVAAPRPAIEKNPSDPFVVPTKRSRPQKDKPESELEQAPQFVVPTKRSRPQTDKPKSELERAPESPVKKKKPYDRPVLREKKVEEPAAIEKTEPKPKKEDKYTVDDLLELDETPSTIDLFQSFPDVDIDVSSPGQSALSMSMLVENLVSGVQDFANKLDNVSDVQIQNNPDAFQKDLNKLVDAFSNQVYMLKSIVETFSEQISS